MGLVVVGWDPSMIEKQFPLISYFHYPSENATAQKIFFSIVGEVLGVKFSSGETLPNGFSKAKLEMQYWTNKLSTVNSPLSEFSIIAFLFSDVS